MVSYNWYFLYDFYKINNCFFDKNKRDYLAREIQRKALNEDVYNFIGYMKMSFVMKNNVSGINPHPTDYYQFNANTNIE